MFKASIPTLLLGLCITLPACDSVPSRDLTAPEPESRTLDAPGLTALAPSNTWTTRRPVPSARFDAGAATINNKIYLLGDGGSNSSTRTLQVYDVASNTWSTRAPLPATRYAINGVSAINGRLYVTGGYNALGVVQKTLYVYDPGTNTWTRKADMPGPGSRGIQAAVANRLYVNTTPHSDVLATEVYRYNPATNRWTTLPPPPNEHRYDAIAAGSGGKFYLIGGRSLGEFPIQQVDVYNPATNSWTSAAPLPTERCCAASATVNGKLYVAGGQLGESGNFAATAGLEVYDPLTNSWSSKAAMSVARFYAAGAAAGGLVFVITGRLDDGTLARKVEAYTP